MGQTSIRQQSSQLHQNMNLSASQPPSYKHFNMQEERFGKAELSQRRN